MKEILPFDLLLELNKNWATKESFWHWAFANHEEIRSFGLVIAGIVGLYFLWSRAKSQDRSSKAMEDTVKNATKSHLVETYARALEQLGASDAEGEAIVQIRLGALHTLKNIVFTNNDYQKPVLSVICAYVKTYFPSNKVVFDIDGEITTAMHDDIEEHKTSKLVTRDWEKVRPDIKTCFNLIGEYSKELSGEADLSSINFDGYELYKLNLQDTNLIRSSFRDALLGGINFQSAAMNFTDLADAILYDANLKGAKLYSANFDGAKFHNTLLKGSDLSKAKNLTPSQLESAITDDDTIFPDYISVTRYEDDTIGYEMIDPTDNEEDENTIDVETTVVVNADIGDKDNEGESAIEVEGINNDKNDDDVSDDGPQIVVPKSRTKRKE